MQEYLELCTPQQLQEMYAEVKASEESLNRDVSYLIEWLEKHPYLPKVNGKSKFLFSLMYQLRKV